MEIIAGTALLTFGGVLCARRARLDDPGRRALRLAALTALALGTPGGLAAGTIGVGWLLSLSRRWRGAGWDLFATGCAAFGRDLLVAGPSALPRLVAGLCWFLGWASLARAARSPASDGQRLRLELLRARRAVAPRKQGDAWRVRAADALARALALAGGVTARPLRCGGDHGALLRRVVDALTEGAAALADGDPDGARARLADARKAVLAARRRSVHANQESTGWLELIDWCEIAAALVDEEVRQ